MSEVVFCARCGNRQHLPDGFSGSAVKCSGCRGEIPVRETPRSEKLLHGARGQDTASAESKFPGNRLPAASEPREDFAESVAVVPATIVRPASPPNVPVTQPARIPPARPVSHRPPSHEEPLSNGEIACRRIGTYLSILGIGSFVLPFFGLQLRLFRAFGAAQIGFGILAVFAGAALLAIGWRRKPAVAIIAPMGVLGSMGLCVLVVVGKNFLQINSASSGNVPVIPQVRSINPTIPQPSAPATPTVPASAERVELLLPAAAEPQPIAHEIQPIEDRESLWPVNQQAESPLPLIEVATDDVLPLGPVGSSDEIQSDDQAPAGGVLVGFRVIQGTSWGGAIKSLQPIYQVESRFVAGEFHGREGGAKTNFVLAPPGYAVGMVQVRSGIVVNSLRIFFYRATDDRLDPADAFATEWIGTPGGADRPPLDGEGDFLIGMRGYYHEDLMGLTLLRAARLGKPEESIPALTGRVTVRRNPQTRPDAESFSDLAPDGGLLVGLRIGQSERHGGAIRWLQPIYQLEGDYVLGKCYGEEGGTARQLLAGPGHAVGAIAVRQAGVLLAVQLYYYPVDEDGLGTSLTYATPWIGADGGPVSMLDGQGHPIIGVSGSIADIVHALDIATLD